MKEYLIGDGRLDLSEMQDYLNEKAKEGWQLKISYPSIYELKKRKDGTNILLLDCSRYILERDKRI